METKLEMEWEMKQEFASQLGVEFIKMWSLWDILAVSMQLKLNIEHCELSSKLRMNVVSGN